MKYDNRRRAMVEILYVWSWQYSAAFMFMYAILVLRQFRWHQYDQPVFNELVFYFVGATIINIISFKMFMQYQNKIE